MHGGNNDYKKFSFLHVGSFFRRGKRLNGEDKIHKGREGGHLGRHLRKDSGHLEDFGHLKKDFGHLRKDVGHLETGRKGRGRCGSCDNIRVKPRKQFIDCIVD